MSEILTNFNNTITFPREKGLNVVGYKIIITEHYPDKSITREPVYIEQIKFENPIKTSLVFEPSDSNVYELPKAIIHTSYHNIIVDLNNNYLDKDKFKYDSNTRTISLDKTINLVESDIIKIYFYLDSIQHEFTSEYRCEYQIEIIYDEDHKVGKHNLIV